MRIFLHSFLHKKFGHHLGFFKMRKVKEGKKYLIRGGDSGPEKSGGGVGGEKGDRYKLKYFFPLYLLHLLSVHSWHERNVDEEGGQER